MPEKKYTLQEAANVLVADQAERRLIDLKADKEAHLRLELDAWDAHEPNYESITHDAGHPAELADQ